MYKFYEASLKTQSMSLKDKIYNLSFSYILFIILMGCIGIGMLYSAANGNLRPWALAHGVRFAAGLGGMIVISLINIKLFLKYSYWFYFFSLFLLIAVEVLGFVGMGAQRWINLGFITIQPSELMKIALVMALAKYFHGQPLGAIYKTKSLIIPAMMIFFPTALILIQPDLGTSLMLIATAVMMVFVCGVQLWKFALVAGGTLFSLPVIWHLLHDYQKERVLTFLNPERDPLGAGYHIIQSKIALGSGGGFGKGFLQGSQSHLNFLPEKHTDFIFTMLSEEFGLVGAVLVILLNILILAYSFSFALKSSSYYGKILAIGLSCNYFLYVFINIAMVIGLLPVVGVPLPLVSYGGTVMLSIMASFGLILSVNIHRHQPLSKE
ncbi:MAG: rod shape-determining protein RodA [Alphaproteobacteria bacterium]